MFKKSLSALLSLLLIISILFCSGCTMQTRDDFQFQEPAALGEPLCLSDFFDSKNLDSIDTLELNRYDNATSNPEMRSVSEPQIIAETCEQLMLCQWIEADFGGIDGAGYIDVAFCSDEKVIFSLSHVIHPTGTERLVGFYDPETSNRTYYLFDGANQLIENLWNVAEPNS